MDAPAAAARLRGGDPVAPRPRGGPADGRGGAARRGAGRGAARLRERGRGARALLRDAARVVNVFHELRGTYHQAVHGSPHYLSYPEYRAYREHARAFDGLAAYAN